MSALRITKSYSKPLVLAASAAVAAGVIYFLSSRFVATSTTGSDSGLDYYSNPNSVLLGRASKDSEPTDAKINEDWTEDELRDWLEKRDVTAPEETSREELLGLAKSIVNI